ncbi:4-hydroxy-tetrahydrodipicolinate reductase [Candidatus Sulfidibacterium hydrothermale]|uniref:4-hydroxy-tetrahydrodipicolinate reductase n=1 Tax=Candidatus Sulfidibacterium hydrothermale TaxID=2875962 RepID=UPI001F0ABE25|nr:4-hydroxy-tetrahydrodipicolinate reductase [Candidatus Sulfidibacterium hydrothermale]UBM61820.1 4-hydroxy-tetrahydrodipicolinate reductase [Candidatus Sulfidibacterium hydrothermale]
MKVIISGYGRMGKMVEQVCRERGHSIVDIWDNASDRDKLSTVPDGVVVIDFSLPESAVENILFCFQKQMPVITGTTGWYQQLPEVKKMAEKFNGTLFYAPNFSLGVNVFFQLNRLFARMMTSLTGYRVSVEEIHHVHKLDAPSGTAIRIAEDILVSHPEFDSWQNSPDVPENVLPVISVRQGEVPGTHKVVYDSDSDTLSIKHEAKNRKGFALGAVLAAEFVQDKKGVFTMRDFLIDRGFPQEFL